MTKRLLVTLLALLLAGLAEAQVGGSPGITSPVSFASPTFTGTTTFGLGTCVSTSANFGKLSGVTPSIKFTGKTDGLCYDTGVDANSEGTAIIHGGRLYAKVMLNGGFTLYGSSVGGLGGGKVFSTSATGGTLYGPDAANATPYTPSTVATWSFTTAQTPNGQFTLAKDSGISFQGATNDAFLTVLYVDNPTASRLIYLPDADGTVVLSPAATDAANSFWGVSNGITFEGATGGVDAFETTLTLTDPTADRTITLPDSGGTLLISKTANEPDTSNAVWANTGSLLFEGSSANTEETELDTVDPTADRTILLPDESGTVTLRSAKSLYTLVQGGYALTGTLTAAPADTIKVTVVDTTPGITDGDVQVCGYTTAGNQTALTKTCEVLDFSGGAAALTTTATFVTVTNIKASTFATLGGGGDETVAAEWTTGPVAIFAAANLVNSAVSNFVGVTVAETLWSPVCIDLAGCNIEPADLTSASDGKTLTVIGRDSTIGLVFTDSANMDIGAAGALTLGVGDAITLMYNSVNAKAWVEVSRSNN